MTSSLEVALETALRERQRRSIPVTDLQDDLLPCPTADLFSNDYLSLVNDHALRSLYLQKLSTAPSLFGSTGSRLGTGNTATHVAFEARMQTFFGAPAALLCSWLECAGQCSLDQSTTLSDGFYSVSRTPYSLHQGN